MRFVWENFSFYRVIYSLRLFSIKKIFNPFYIWLIPPLSRPPLYIVPYITIDDDRGVSTPEKFYKKGSTIELKCIVDKIPNRSNSVMWKHGMRMLNYDTSRGGIRYIYTVFHLFIKYLFNSTPFLSKCQNGYAHGKSGQPIVHCEGEQ